ncbi:dihydrodipicolinate synthase family protein, partial [Clavibacter michiganensis]|uniref:dihydrodipicolinate synthase family protein n=1 Tax=Clavibacter michiganensis TaxID=28447 RepID=UPI00374E05D1
VGARQESSGDVRGVPEIQVPTARDVVAGGDVLLLEPPIMGAVGGFAGYPNACPREAVELYGLATSGRIEEAKELYKHLVPVFRWDSCTDFVQATNLSIDLSAASSRAPTLPTRTRLSAALAFQRPL